MKPSGGQYRSDVGDASLPRSSGQHVPVGGHPVYLSQHHPPFGAQSAGESPRGSRDYHPHHLQAQDMPHRNHVMGSGAIGMSTGPVPIHHLPQRRRTSGHRLSLLFDIGVAGERDRDRTESMGGSGLLHTYTSTVGSSHVSRVLYGGRPSMTMMSSLGGLQASQKNLGSGSQLPAGTPPRHNPSTLGSLGRPSPSSLHAYSAGAGPFMLPGPSSVKTEPGISTFIKEESKSPIPTIQSHYPPQLVHSQSYSGHPSLRAVSPAKDDPPDKDVENVPSRDSVVQSIAKVDKEIKKVSSEIKGLERKQQQLENAAKKPPQIEKSSSPKKVETKHKDLWQVIYAENKKKAGAARGMLDHLGKRYDMPLYNQPSDTKVYQDNLKKNEEMRPKLLAYFQHSSQLASIRERYLSARHNQLMTDWQKKTERFENKRKQREIKIREFFEKQFPEIRKQREQQERFTRSGTRGGDACRSEADFNEIVDGLSEQENQEHHMRQLSVVPPALLDRDQRRLKFINNNGLVTDPMEDYKKRQELDHWNAEEKQIFKEKYIQHPKNFHIIASFLEKKSVADCVLFYYLSKKSVGYKAFVRKTLKPRKVKSGRGHAQQSSNSGSAQGPNKNGQQDKGQGEKDSEQKREPFESIVKEEEVERIERPPSPIVTRSRNKNWSDEDVVVAKEGFEKHGKDFAAVSRLFTNKTEHQIKSFYNTYKKKHNLDQLISDGKKKKAEAATSSAAESETSSAPPRVTTSSSSQIRTRRSAGQSVKRGSKSPTADEPAEKKARKSKATKEVKTELREIPVEEDQKVEPDAQDKEMEITDEEKQEEQPAIENVDVKVQEEPAEAVPDGVRSAVSSVPPVEPAAPTVSTPSEQVKDPSTPISVLKTPIVTTTEAATKAAQSPALETPARQDTRTTRQPTADAPLQKSNANDGDSSATCSADEEPNMQDVEPKVAARKHVDSPYAFEDDSSASIKLEKSRSPLPPLSSAPVMKQPLPAKTPPNVGRPASTHPPQPMTLKPDENRPQSLPPPLGAIPAHSVPIGASTFNRDDPRPNSTPMIAPVYTLPPALCGIPFGPAWMNPASNYGGSHHHIVGKVPDANEIRNALSQPTSFLATAPTTAPLVKANKKTVTSEPCQTIDLTVLSTSASECLVDESVKAKDPVQKLPHYHPVPPEASSLQKDFAQPRADGSRREGAQTQQQHEYSSSQILSMKQRAANIPVAIPVSALRAPMTGNSSQRKDVQRSEPVSKPKENPPVMVDVSGPPRPYILTGQPLGMVHGADSGVRPYLTTSPIQTKVLYGMTSGAPIRQDTLGKAPSASASETRRPDIITSTQHAPDPARYRRSPGPETSPQTGRQYFDSVKTTLPQARGLVVKSRGLDQPIVVPDDSFKKAKPAPGSIMTGLPVHRSHDERTEHRTEVIAGKKVVVKQPYPRASPVMDPARFQDSEQIHGLHYPHPAHHRPVMPPKGSPGTGSIIDGTPVKRKPSEDSNSSLSPSANLTPYLGAAVSRPSPTTIPKHSERRLPSGQPPYHFLAGPERTKEKDPFPGHQKLMREAQSRPSATSPGLRQPPASAIVKQEFQDSLHPAGELLRRGPAAPLSFMDFHQLTNPDLARLSVGLPHIPLTAPGVSQDFLEIWRQYRAASASSGSHVYSMFLPPGIPGAYPLGYPVQGLNPAASPGAPRSPQNDDSRESVLTQAYETAQIMSQQRNPAPSTVPGLPVLAGVAPTISVPGMGISPLVVSAANPYHPLVPGPYLTGALPADRLVLQMPHGMSRSPFPSQFPLQPGRTSTDRARSPSQKNPKTGSPDVLRQRHRSSEPPREFTHHPTVRGRNSPSSPYHSPGGNISPQRYPSQGPPAQLNSSQPSKSYRGYPHSSTPPAHSTYPHRQTTRSPHMLPTTTHPYPESAIASAMLESRSPYEVQHTRTGSLDGLGQPRFERSRPDSAASHPRSTNDPSGKYPAPHIRQQSQSPKYRPEPESRPSQVAPHEQKIQSSRDDRSVHRESPRPVARRPVADHGDARLPQQPSALAGGPYQATTGGARHEVRSPYQHHQSKERMEPARVKEQPQNKADVKPPRPDTSRMSQAVSTNPMEDLKKSGRTTLNAGMLVNQIIMNCVHNQQSLGPSQPPPPVHVKQPSDPGQRKPPDESEPKLATLPAKTSYEAETRLPHTSAQGPPSHLFTTAQLPQLGKEAVSAHPPTMARTTFAKHSSDLIEHMYRRAVPERKSSPLRTTASPLPQKPTVMVAEPISPPEKRMGKPGNSEVSQPPPTVLSQMQQQPRYPGRLPDSKPRPDAPRTRSSPTIRPLNPQPAAMTGPVLPAHPTSGTSSLDDLIRNALMDHESRTPASMNGSHDNHTVRLNDMFISHAMYSAVARMPAPQGGNHTPEMRKETPPVTAQSQSGSANYMSALMFRSAPSQNVTPPAPPERTQQFYQAPNRPSHAAPPPSSASQSPAPQEPNPPARQPILMPQYEALSDSD